MLPWLHKMEDRNVVAGSGAPLFIQTIINNGDGNDTFDVLLSRNVESPGGNPKLGWTVEQSDDGASWSTIDLTSATVSISNNLVKFDLSGLTRGRIPAHLQFRTSYSSVTGDIRNVVDQTDLATFSNSTMYSNNSTIDLTSNVVDWYQFSEASGQTRVAEISSPSGDLTDTNTVGVRTGPSGSGNATDHTGTNYLSKDGVLPAPADGKFTIAFYYQQDVLPSVKGAGDAYVFNRWRSDNNREWAFLVPDTAEGSFTINTMYIAAQNSDNDAFTQRLENRGAFTNGTWYIVIGVFDPDAAVPITGYTQQLNTKADFTIDDDNSVFTGDSESNPQVKQVGGSVALQVGDAFDLGTQQGVDGGVDTPIMWERALSEEEARCVAEGYSDPDDNWKVDTV